MPERMNFPKMNYLELKWAAPHPLENWVQERRRILCVVEALSCGATKDLDSGKDLTKLLLQLHNNLSACRLSYRCPIFLESSSLDDQERRR